MKNVQIIDGADNCTFSIFQFSDEQFEIIFGADGQNIAFIDEVALAISSDQYKNAFESVWDRPILKHEIAGLHGTLFYGYGDRKAHFPKSRRERDWDYRSINYAQRALNAKQPSFSEP